MPTYMRFDFSFYWRLKINLIDHEVYGQGQDSRGFPKKRKKNVALCRLVECLKEWVNDPLKSDAGTK